MSILSKILELKKAKDHLAWMGSTMLTDQYSNYLVHPRPTLCGKTVAL